MTTNCTHEVLPLTAPIAVRCEDCGQLMPYVPEPAGEPIVLTGTSAMFKSDYDKLLATRAAERMARKSDACWEHRSAQHDCPNCPVEITVHGPDGGVSMSVERIHELGADC